MAMTGIGRGSCARPLLHESFGLLVHPATPGLSQSRLLTPAFLCRPCLSNFLQRANSSSRASARARTHTYTHTHAYSGEKQRIYVPHKRKLANARLCCNRRAPVGGALGEGDGGWVGGMPAVHAAAADMDSHPADRHPSSLSLPPSPPSPPSPPQEGDSGETGWMDGPDPKPEGRPMCRAVTC